MEAGPRFGRPRQHHARRRQRRLRLAEHRRQARLRFRRHRRSCLLRLRRQRRSGSSTFRNAMASSASSTACTTRPYFTRAGFIWRCCTTTAIGSSPSMPRPGRRFGRSSAKPTLRARVGEAYSSPVLWNDGKETTLVVLGCDYTTGHRLSDGAEIWRLRDLNPSKELQQCAPHHRQPRGLDRHSRGADGARRPDRRPEARARPATSPRAVRSSGGGKHAVLRTCLHRSFTMAWSTSCRRAAAAPCSAGTPRPARSFTAKASTTTAIAPRPVYADGKIYVLSRDGTALVVQAGKKFQLLATNNLNDNFTASPAIADGRIYLRGFKGALCDPGWGEIRGDSA